MILYVRLYKICLGGPGEPPRPPHLMTSSSPPHTTADARTVSTPATAHIRASDARAWWCSACSKTETRSAAPRTVACSTSP
jgi:hypothetical protein